MMSKAAYMMQDHIRRSYSYITDIYKPNTFICRGRLSFPQGLTAIALWFHQKTPADLYAHPYFIEKQSNPNQPSPQMHTTEEVQGIMKVMQGLRYMRDDFSKLDNTMCVVTDYLVPAKATMLVFDSKKYTSSAGGDDPPLEEKANKEEEEEDRRHPTLLPSQRPAFQTMEKLHEAPYKPSRLRFPSTNEAVSNAAATQAFLREVLQAHKTSLRNASPIANLEMGAAGEGDERFENATVRYCAREGGYTVLYNPCEVNERTLAELILRLEREERVVKAIVVPTRQTWRDLQVWADIFPDAAIIASGQIPIAPAEGGGGATPPPDSHGAPPTAHRYRDFGNGVMGISFPEVDLEAEEGKGEGEGAGPPEGTSEPDPPPAPRPLQGFTHGEDIADVLWTSEASHMFAEGDGKEPLVARYGLRDGDARRVRDLSKEARPASVMLTPRIELVHVPGDAITDEYVLYDHHSRHLACVDLFHGEYSDFDALNTWLCRVWFKFMRRGNHKRTDLVPRFKWRQVCQQGTLPVLRRWLDNLTRRRGIRGVVCAHGTPPLVEDPANRLRGQWNLPPLTREELRRAEGRAVPEINTAAAATREQNPRGEVELSEFSRIGEKSFF